MDVATRGVPAPFAPKNSPPLVTGSWFFEVVPEKTRDWRLGALPPPPPCLKPRIYCNRFFQCSFRFFFQASDFFCQYSPGVFGFQHPSPLQQLAPSPTNGTMRGIPFFDPLKIPVLLVLKYFKECFSNRPFFENPGGFFLPQMALLIAG